MTALAARRIARFLFPAAAALLAACAPMPPSAPQPSEQPPLPIVEPVPQPPPPSPQARVSDADRLLSYYEFLLALNADQLAQEKERTMRFYGQHRSEFALLQLVLLHMVPSAPRPERTQASEMLSSYLKDTRERPSELRPLALFLNNQLTELQKQEAETQAQSARLREEVRKGEQYRQKLDALIETERKILERSKPARNP